MRDSRADTAHTGVGAHRLIAYGLGAAGSLAGIFLLSFYDFLLFHFAVELTSISIAFALFALTWAARNRIEDGGFVVLGVAYLFVGAVDLLHTLSYAGTGLFPQYGADLPTQLWLVARGVETASIYLAFACFGRRVNHRLLAGLYAAVTLLLVLSVIPLRWFPVAYQAETGLTAFKIGFEYLLSAALLGAALLLYRQRARLDRVLYSWLLLAVLATAAAELLFTFYIDVYGLSNVLGHLLKIVSFFAIFKAIIERGVHRPDRLFYSRLAGRERELSRSLEQQEILFRELQHRMKNDMTLIHSFLEVQASDSQEPAVQAALQEASGRVAVLSRVYQNLYQHEDVSHVDLTVLIERTVEDLQESTALPGIEFTTELEDLIVSTKVAVAVGIVLNELVTNAVKYAFSDSSSPRIVVRLRALAAGRLELEFRDNGAGLPATTRRGEEFGYGLKVVSALAEQHGGTVQLGNDGGAVIRVDMSTDGAA